MECLSVSGRACVCFCILWYMIYRHWYENRPDKVSLMRLSYGPSVVLSVSRNSTSSVTKCGWMCCRGSPFFMATSGNQKPPCEWMNEFWLFSTLSYSTVSSVGWQLSSVWMVLKSCYMQLIMCTEFDFQCCSDHLVLNIWHRKHPRHFHQLCYNLVWLYLYLHLPCISQSTDFLAIHGFSLFCLEYVVRYNLLNIWKYVF